MKSYKLLQSAVQSLKIKLMKNEILSIYQDCNEPSLIRIDIYGSENLETSFHLGHIRTLANLDNNEIGLEFEVMPKCQRSILNEDL